MFCQKDSYTKEIETDVLVCVKTEKGWEIELKDSIFYPEGGGQPADRGWIGDTPILDVQKRDGHVYCYAETAVPCGAQHVRIDWEHRFDSMQQHTGQHLLTALILDRFSWKTIGFHISADVSTIDLETPEITQEECLEIEAMVQKSILEQRRVHPILVSREEFENMSIRSRGVPEWVEGPIRLIEIEGIDTNNCGGTHVSNTAQLQMFAIVGTEKLKKNTRLTFVYGDRVLRMFRRLLQKEKDLNRIFQEGNHIERAMAWAQERKEHKIERKSFTEYRCVQEGKVLAENPEDVVVHFSVQEDLEFLKGMMTKASVHAPQKSFLLFSNQVLVASVHDEEKYNHMVHLFRSLGGKGGGRAPLFQGKWNIIDGEELLREWREIFQ